MLAANREWHVVSLVANWSFSIHISIVLDQRLTYSFVPGSKIKMVISACCFFMEASSSSCLFFSFLFSKIIFNKKNGLACSVDCPQERVGENGS